MARFSFALGALFAITNIVHGAPEPKEHQGSYGQVQVDVVAVTLDRGKMRQFNIALLEAVEPGLRGGMVEDRKRFLSFLRALEQKDLARFHGEITVVTPSGRRVHRSQEGPSPEANRNSPSPGMSVDVFAMNLENAKIHVEVTCQVQRDRINTQSVRHAVQIQEGETLVLPGPVRESLSASTTKVPILGDLPLIGTAFQKVTWENTEHAFMILVTARRVPGPLQEADMERSAAPRVVTVPEQGGRK